jgi:hypothetical protein
MEELQEPELEVQDTANTTSFFFLLSHLAAHFTSL